METEQATVETYSTLEELRAAAEGEVAAGREVLPYTRPEAGAIGFVSFRRWEDQSRPPPDGWDEEMKRLEWPVFGFPLEPDVRTASSLRELVEFMDSNRDYVMQCSDPVQRLVGAVSYARARGGASDVVRIPLTKIKEGSPEDVEKVKELMVPSRIVSDDSASRMTSIAERIRSASIS